MTFVLAVGSDRAPLPRQGIVPTYVVREGTLSALSENRTKDRAELEHVMDAGALSADFTGERDPYQGQAARTGNAEPRVADPALLKSAMRRLVGGVVVVTAGIGDERVGLTATSATSLSIEPPTMLVCLNRTSSTWPVIAKHKHFCVSILGAGHQDVAERFAGMRKVRGAARYHGSDWTIMRSGASGLADAQAVIDCELDEVIERHSHVILLGAVREIRVNRDDDGALVYGRGRFSSFGPV